MQHPIICTSSYLRTTKATVGTAHAIAEGLTFSALNTWSYRTPMITGVATTCPYNCLRMELIVDTPTAPTIFGNFLNLPNALLLPVLSKDFDCTNDREAIRVMQNLYPGKQIIPIYAKSLNLQ